MWSFVRTALIDNGGTSNWSALVVLSNDGVEESRFVEFGKSQPSQDEADAAGQSLCAFLNEPAP